MSSSNDGTSNARYSTLGTAALFTLALGGSLTLLTRKRSLPVVMIHGILDNAQNMEESAAWVRAALGKGSYVRCLEVGNGEIDSIIKPMSWQLERLADQIQTDKRLHGGLHIIGYSQGSLLARAFVQAAVAHAAHPREFRLREFFPPVPPCCLLPPLSSSASLLALLLPSLEKGRKSPPCSPVQMYGWPKVHTLISWVGPQAGQFGVPDWEDLLKYLNQITSP
ncbi:MAG: hypothetical protein SGPRY_005963, partial [Prymnesium sp.]